MLAGNLIKFKKKHTAKIKSSKPKNWVLKIEQKVKGDISTPFQSHSGLTM